MLGEAGDACKSAPWRRRRIHLLTFELFCIHLHSYGQHETKRMSGKSIPLSVRVSDEDAEFLAALEIEAALTPSEKLRALIARARAEAGEGRSFEAALARLRAQLEPTAQLLRARELEGRGRSQLIHEVLQALPDLAAFLVAGPAPATRSRQEDLAAFEQGVADRAFRLAEAVLRLGVTDKAPCYNPDVVAQGATGTLELSRVILSRRQRTHTGSEA
jgi:hypothetical protein